MVRITGGWGLGGGKGRAGQVGSVTRSGGQGGKENLCFLFFYVLLFYFIFLFVSRK